MKSCKPKITQSNIFSTKTPNRRPLKARFYVETGCTKCHLNAISHLSLSSPFSTGSQNCNFVNPPSRSKCYHVLMAATHPPSSPVEEHHQQSASKKSQDSLINLLIVPDRDKDCRCRNGEGKGGKKKLHHS